MKTVELESSEVNLIRNALANYREEVVQNLGPMFYHSLTYEGDVRIKELADSVADKLGLK